MSTHKPATRDEFKALLLRKLGSPVISINVSDDQIEDCIEEALKYYADYHYDGTEHVYYIHTVTADDKTNRYITVPEEIIGVTEIYSLATQPFQSYSADMFSGGYQMAFDFVFNTTSGQITTYYLNKTAYEFMSQILIGQTALRYNRHVNKLHVDMNWERVPEGSKIIVDGYQVVVSADTWNDRWLQKYAAAKIKYIWGSNMSKFEGMQLPGGLTLNGTKTQDDAKDEIQQLEDEMISNYSIPPRDMIA